MVFDHQWADGPPLIFETMVFGIADYQPQWRYSTEDEAKLGQPRGWLSCCVQGCKTIAG
jgi:hypothetical protein